MSHMIKALLLVLFATNVWAQVGPQLSYHGRIVDSVTNLGVTGSVDFKIQVKTPTTAADSCIMYEETQTKSLNNGVFVVGINNGTGTRTDSSGYTVQQIFSNKNTFGSFALAGSACTSGSAFTYTPTATDARQVNILFHDASMPVGVYEPLPAQTVAYVPSAIESLNVGGFPVDALLRVVTAGGSPATMSPLSNAQYTELMNLIGGTSTRYLLATNPAVGFTGALVGDVSGTQGATSVDKIKGVPVSGTAPTAGYYLKYNGASWIAAPDSGGTVTNVSSGNSYISITGGTSTPVVTANVGTAANTLAAGNDARIVGAFQTSTALTSGDLTGALPSPTVAFVGGKTAAQVATSVNDTTAATASATASTIVKRDASGNSSFVTAQATNFSGRNVYFFDGTNTNSVQLKAPNAFGTSYTITLPTAVPVANTVLGTNASGDLSWVSPIAGAVTGVSASAPLVSSGGFTPNISMPAASAGADGYLASTDWTTFNNKLSTALPNGQVWVGNVSGVATARNFNSIDIKAAIAPFGNWFNVAGGCATGTALNYSVVTDQVSCTAYALTSSQVTTALGYTPPSNSLAAGNIFVGNASGVATGVVMSGDATMGVSGDLTIVSSAITTSKIANLAVTDAKINDVNWGKITSTPTTIAGYGITDAILVNAGGVTTMQAANMASRPAAGSAGRIFITTDTAEIYRDDGVTWVKVGSAVGLGGTVTNVTGASPVSVTSGTSTPVISISQSNAITNGYLGSSDWSMFNAKLGTASTFSGDVTGTSSTMSVDKIKGANLNISGLASANYLRYNGTDWVNQNLQSSDITNALTYTPFNGALANGNIFVGSGGLATGFTPSGDVSSVAGGVFVFANTGVTAGTYKSVTVDAKGRVTNGTNPTTLSGFGITDGVQNTGVGAGKVISSMSSGTFATRPAASTDGRIYFATDTQEIYRDNGASWVKVGSANGTGGTVTAVATAPANVLTVLNPTTTPIIMISQSDNTTDGYLTSADWTTFSNKLDKAGGTMSGTIAMGGNDITGTGNILMSANKSIGISNLTAAQETTLTGTLTAADKGRVWYNSTSGQLKYWDGSGAQAVANNSGSVASLNGQTGSLVITAGSSAASSDFTVTTSGSNITLNLPTATSTVRGALSSSDWTTFNNKIDKTQAFSGDVTGTYGAIALVNSGVSAGTYGSASSVPSFTVDAKGRITNATSQAYQDATNVTKGVVQIGSNITLNSGVISVSSSDVSNALGYVPGISALANGNIFVGNASGIATSVTMSGDATIVNSGILTINAGAITTSKIANLAVTNAQIATGIQWSKITSTPTTIAGYGITDAILTNAGGVTSMQASTLAGRPAAGTAGRMFVSTDTGEIYRDNGATWDKVGSATGLGGTVTNVTGTAPVSVATGTSTPVISISQANGTTDGYLGSSDWSTFNNKVSLTTVYSGDVSGNASTTSVDKIKGKSVVPVAYAANQYLRYDGTNWVNSLLVSSDITTYLGYTPVNKAGDSMTGVLAMGSNDITGTGNILMSANKSIGVSNLTAAQETTLTGTLVAADKGRVWYNSTSGQLKYWDGAAAQAVANGSGSVASVNGQTGAITVVAGSSAASSDFTVTTSGSNITLNLPTASSTVRGALSSADWSMFNNKVSLTTVYSGDVSGNASTTSVDKIKGQTLALGANTSGNYLRNNGTGWVNSALVSSDITTSLGTLPIANGGTGATTANTALNNLLPAQSGATSGKALVSNGANASWTAVTNGTVTSVGAALPIVISGSATSTPVITINVADNTNDGYLTTADWNIFNAKMDITTVVSGDVSGPATGLTVDKIKGKSVVPVGYATNQYLRYDGTNWVNSLLVSSDITTSLGFTPATNALANGKIFIGSAGGVATAQTMSGDASISNTGSLTLTNSATTRSNLGLGTAAVFNVPVAGDAAVGEVVKGNDSRLTDARTPTGAASGDLTGTYPAPTLTTTGVTAGSNYSKFTVDAKGRVTGASTLSSADVTGYLGYTPLNKAGDTMSGVLTMGANIAMGGNDITGTGNILMSANKSIGISNLTAAQETTLTGTLTAADKGRVWYNSTSGQLKYWDGAAAQAVANGSGSVASVNGQTGAITVAAGSSAASSDFTVTTSGSNITLNLPTASSTVRGALSSADWTAFNAKLSTSTNVSGDVSGPVTGLTVDKIKGQTLTLGANTSGNYLRNNGTGWVNSALVSTDITTSLGTLPIANGGTGATTANTALNNLLPAQSGATSGKALVSNGANVSWTAVTNGTVTSVGAALPIVISGSATSTPVITINVADNTNDGYLTTADWNTFNNKVGLTTVYSGDVSGNASTTSVDKIKGKSVVPVGYATNQYLRYDGTNWVNSLLVSSDITTSLGYVPLNKAGDNMTGALAMGSNDITGTGNILMSANKSIGISNLTAAQETTLIGTLVAADKGRMWYNSTSGQLKYWDGAAAQAVLSGSGMVSSVNGQTGAITVAAGSSAASSDFTVTTSGSNITLNLPTATSTVRGALSSADWSTFNAKMDITTVHSGDVSGNASTMSVDKIKGQTLTLGANTSGNYLRNTGTGWVNSALVSTDITTSLGYVPTTSSLANGKIFIGSAGGVAAAQTVTGDASLANDGTLTLANVATAGTYPKVTIDAKGRVTSGGALVSSDIPNLDANKITSGQLAIANGGTGAATANAALNNLLPTQTGNAGKALITDGAGTTSWTTLATGTVTNVTGTSPVSVTSGTSTPVISISQANSTTNGYLGSADWTAFNAKLGTSTSVSGDVSGSVTALSVDKIKGQTLTLGASTAGNYLRNTGAGWVNSALVSSDITTSLGILDVPHGGTGAATIGSGNLIVGGGTGAVTSLAAGSSGNVVVATGVSTWVSTDPDTAGLVNKTSVQSISGAKTFGATVKMSNQNLFQLGDTGANAISMRAPAAVTTSYTLTWPAAVGSLNQVLTTDASGNLSWATPSGGVTSVTATAPISVATGSTTPAISITRATASVDGYLASSDFTTFNAKMSTSTVVSGDVSGPATGLTVDKIKGTALSISSLTSGNFLKFTGTNWVNSNLTSTDVSTGSGFVNGGNSFGGATSVGTNDSNNLTVKTNNTTRLTIDTLGGVQVSGQAWSQSATSSVASPLAWDANTGNTMVWTTNTASPTVNMTNLKTGGSYMLVISGTGTGSVTFTCNGSGTALSFMPANGSRIAGTKNKSVYTILFDGTDCLITWITGF